MKAGRRRIQEGVVAGRGCPTGTDAGRVERELLPDHRSGLAIEREDRRGRLRQYLAFDEKLEPLADALRSLLDEKG